MTGTQMLFDHGSSKTQSHDERFRQLIDSIEVDGIYMLDSVGHVLTWNRGAELNKGYTRQEILGKHFKIFFVPEDVEAGLPDRELEAALRVGRFAGEGWRLRKNGERFWASVVLTTIRGSNGTVTGLAQVIRDLTGRKRQEDALRTVEANLREERDRLHAAVESSLDAFFICQALRGPSGEIEDFVFTYLNSNVEKLVSIPRNLMLGGMMCELMPQNRESGFFERYKQVVITGIPFVSEYQLQAGNANSTWVRVQAVKLRDGIAITASDISERKHNEQRITHLAQHDSLTGLPNRNLLEDRINQSIAFAKRENLKVGVLLIDLDAFKQINDTFGHAVGDEVLRTVAQRLKEVMRASDSIVRIGGDEFVAVVPWIHQIQELIGVVNKIIDTFRPPIVVGLHTIVITCSVGISVYPDSAVKSKDLLDRADVAMYASKHAGKNRYNFFGQTTRD
jgi:diguanylate cyclase (GGDEF)-like protein/PAS domain S-box-containing protein